MLVILTLCCYWRHGPTTLYLGGPFRHRGEGGLGYVGICCGCSGIPTLFYPQLGVQVSSQNAGFQCLTSVYGRSRLPGEPVDVISWGAAGVQFFLVFVPFCFLYLINRLRRPTSEQNWDAEKPMLALAPTAEEPMPFFPDEKEVDRADALTVTSPSVVGDKLV